MNSFEITQNFGHFQKGFTAHKNLKVEHCVFLHLVACQYFHNSWLFIFQISNSFVKKKNIYFSFLLFFQKSTDEALNFRIKKINQQGIVINKLPNTKNPNVLTSKLRLVKTFKCEKCHYTLLATLLLTSVFHS